MNPRHVLITDFNGLGNGLIMLPLLKQLEAVAPAHRYFYMDNPVFEARELIDWFGLSHLQGLVPAIWRRFDTADRPQIHDFISRNEIDLIINLRNEDPRLDARYFEFKQELRGRPLCYWEMYEAVGETSERRHAAHNIVELFAIHGIDLSGFNRFWMRDYFAAQGRPGAPGRAVGFFTAASQLVKRWPAQRWVRLGELLLDHGDYTLEVYAGLAEDERQLAEQVAAALQARFGAARCRLVASLPLLRLAERFKDLRFLVSNDSASIHLAAALGLPTVGLYFSTDGVMWAGLGNRFITVQSAFGLACPAQKRTLGNCTFYYGGCPAPCKDEVTPERVFADLGPLLAGPPAAQAI